MTMHSFFLLVSILLSSMVALSNGFGMSISMSASSSASASSISNSVSNAAPVRDRVGSSSPSPPSQSSQQRYAVNLKFTIKPERRDDFLNLIRDNQRKTLDLEPAALQYVVGEDIHSTNTFYLHEEFIGSQGFDAHRDMPHAADWATFKSTMPFVEGTGEPTLDFFFDYDSSATSIESADNEKQEPPQIPIRPAFCVHVELFVKPEYRQEFIKVIQNNQKGTLGTEPLCLQYVFGESTSTPNKFVFHEEYTGDEDGKEGFDAHTQTPHFKLWEEFVEKDPFTSPPIVNFFKTI